MINRILATTIMAAAGALALATTVAGQAPAAAPAARAAQAKPYSVPKTPWGDPDIQGVWTSDQSAGVPFERPAQFGGKAELSGDELEEVLEAREAGRVESAPLSGGETGAGPVHWFENWGQKSARTSLVVDPPDGRLPPRVDQPAGGGRGGAPAAGGRGGAPAAAGGGRGGAPGGNRTRADSWLDRSLYDRCITRGVPSVMFPTIYNNNSRLVQGPGWVAITYEMIHETRVIPIDNRPYASDKIRTFMGDSRGRWEGNKLVVESRNFDTRMAYRGVPADRLKLKETFERLDDGVLRYEVTVDDPQTYARPWTARLDLTPQVELFEYGCHEGNYAMRNILSAARAEEKAAAEAAQKK
jgi:hypothetical protein